MKLNNENKCIKEKYCKFENLVKFLKIKLKNLKNCHSNKI